MSETRPPLLLPCENAAAEDVARELAARGLAEIVEDIEQVVVAAREGRHVIALDACGTSCRARLLDAHGVEALRSLGLSGADAGSVAELEAAAGAVKLGRAPAPAADEADSRRLHSLGDYLVALDRLTFSVVDCGAVADGPTLAAHVAQILGVSRPAAGEMLARLEDAGLVHRGAHREVLLTHEGRVAADAQLRKQRILECFATELGYTVEQCNERAREIASGFGDDAVERVWHSLGRPERCPHGWPIDPAEARASVRGLRALSTVDAAEEVVVERLDELRTTHLEALTAAGVAPGRTLAHVHLSAAAGVVDFELAGEPTRLGLPLAASVLVRV